jgi:glycerophosphoryl diester phosphodiesterase
LASGADGVELDCRMTLDGALVVRHDDDLPDGGSVSGLSVAALMAADARVPLLEEALDVIGDAWRVVELKTTPRPEFVSLVAEALGPRLTPRLIVSSFDPLLLRAFRAALPQARTALILGFAMSEPDVLWAVDEAVGAGHDQVHAERQIALGPLGSLLRSATAERGLELVVWTVNDPGEASALRDLGATAVITDVPDILIGR